MNIFKSFMKIMRKHLTAALIYLTVFLIVGIAMTKTSSSGDSGYENTSLKISVTDLDDSEASRAAVKFIEKNNKLVEIGRDKDEQLDALYYGKADIIITIEKGYSEKLEAGETLGLFSEYSVPGTYSAILFDSQLNRYIGMVSAGVLSGDSSAEASLKANDILADEVETVMLKNETETDSLEKNLQYYFFKYLAYILVAVIMSGLCPVLLVMNKRDIRRRVNCSSISSSSQLIQTALGILVFSVGLYIILMVSGMILYKSEMFTTHGLLGMLNVFVFVIVALTLCMMISSFSPSEKSVSMITNVVGLGMSFLCGVFVPQNLLGGAAMNIGKLLPAFWYVKANNILMEMEDEVFSYGEFFVCLGVELAFATAMFGVSLILSKTKRQSED